MKRQIVQTVRGMRAVDGAGVRLVRVLGNANVREFDPFLMLDSFDSTDPADYIAGFPMHPHRGIETLTYLISGRIEHQDTLGNKGVIHSGECQWMTAGSGILHQEMPKPAERMLGFQLWLNMPAAEKMDMPHYLAITQKDMTVVRVDGADVRVLSGTLEGQSGIKPQHIPASVWDVALPAGHSIRLPVHPDETVFTFLIEGDGVVNGREIPVKTSVLFGQGDEIEVQATQRENLRFIFFSGRPLHEPIAWGGPIVMNTQAELNRAFDELEDGTFLKHRVSI